MHRDHVQLMDLFCPWELDLFRLAPGLGRHKPQPLPENKPGWINCEEPGDKHLIHQLSWKSRRDNSPCQSHCSKGISLRHTGAGKDEPGVRVTREEMGVIGLSGVVCLLCGRGKPPSVVLISMGKSLCVALWPLACREGQQCFCREFQGQTEALCGEVDFSVGKKGLKNGQ